MVNDVLPLVHRFVLSPSLFVGGGYEEDDGDNPVELDSCFELSLAHGCQAAWTQRAPLPIAIGGATMVARGHDLSAAEALFIGGRELGGHCRSATMFFSRRTNTWSAGLSLCTARADHGAAELNDDVTFVVGGKDVHNNILNSTELLHPPGALAVLSDNAGAEVRWRAGIPMHEGRALSGVACLRRGLHGSTHRVLVAGGVNMRGDDTSRCMMFDTYAARWTNAAALSEEKSSLCATPLSNGSVLAIGGWGVPSWYEQLV